MVWSIGSELNTANLNDLSITTLKVSSTVSIDGKLSLGDSVDISNTDVIRWRNSGDTDFLSAMWIDASNQLNIGRDDGITNVQFFQKTTWFDDTASPIEVASMSSAGELITSASTIRIAEANAGGGLAGDATGTKGDIAWGSSSNVSYLYVCVSTDSWMRATLNPF